MKSLRKITAWAMALAIASTAAAMTTAYAEGEEDPIEVLTEAPTDVLTEAPTELITEIPTEALTDAPTAAPTEAPTLAPVTGDVSGTVQGIEVRITGNDIYMNFTALGFSVDVKGNKATFDGAVIDDSNLTFGEFTEEEILLVERVAEVMNNVSISEIVFTDNVTDIKTAVFDASEIDNCTKITFGKNIKTISDNMLGNTSASPTVYGYLGTAAEKYAKNKGFTFSALDAAPSTTSPAATKPAKVTTTVKTTAKSSKTTAKSTDSPKTGDAGTVTGVLAIAAAAGLLSMKKRKHE